MRNYPDFSLVDFFTQSIIPIKACCNKKSTDEHGVHWSFNSYGYRTHEFENVNDHALVLGCSLTEGHGLQIGERWADWLEESTAIKVFNLAKGGTNAEFCYRSLSGWISSYNPKFVIVQWPNFFRKLFWNQLGAVFTMNSSNDKLYSFSLKESEDNFYHHWAQSIIDSNQLCRQKQIPIINLYLDGHEFLSPKILTILDYHGINLHCDHKQPGKTWHFDNASLDGQHHSSGCNKKWAQRIEHILENLIK